MATEPQRPIENLLRAWATRRRAGAPRVELHPATRRMLQSEAARVHPPGATGKSPRRWPVAFWPRLALAGGGLAVVVGMVFLFSKSDRGTPLELARVEKNFDRETAADRGQVAATPAPAPAASPAPVPATITATELSLAVSGPRVMSVGGQATAASEAGRAARSPSTDDSIKLPERTVRGTVADEASVRAAATSPGVAFKAAAAPPMVAESRQATLPRSEAASAPVDAFFAKAPEGRPVVSQKFSRADDGARLRQNLNSPPPTAVLINFQVQQLDGVIRLIDADGSVYEGRTLGSVPAVQADREKDKASVEGKVDAGAARVLFRVLGTNLTQRERVEFEGTLGAGRIEGRAFIGSRTQLELRATSVP